MKFGKDFTNHLEETLPEWRDKFLCYKYLKKLIKHHLPDSEHHLEDWFVNILNLELEKLNDFYIDQEEDFVIRLQVLKDRIERVRLSKNGNFSSASEFSEEMLDIRTAFVTIHGEMVLLINYSSLNFQGLVKILKKFDKRTGGLLSLPFTRLARDQPFFLTEQLTELVHECEANLELLFPVEAEVVECDDGKTETSDKKNNTATSSSSKEDVNAVYRSTLAAIKAIQGLRKASSTDNPLSLARFFHVHDSDDEAPGNITSENSDSNVQKSKDEDEDSD